MNDKKTESKYEFKFNFKEIVFFVIGAIGVISLFFIVGLWIGKGLNETPSEIVNNEYVTTKDYPEGTSATEGAEGAEDEKLSEETLSEEKVIDVAEGGKDSLEFQDSLKKDEIIPLKEEDKTKKEATPKAADEKAAKAKAEVDNIGAPKKEDAKSKDNKAEAETASKKKEDKKVATASGNSKKGDYVVQLASLKDDKAALNLVAKLKKSGFDAYFITMVLGDKGTYYRVRVGKSLDKKDAETMLENIEKETKIKGMVVKDS